MALSKKKRNAIMGIAAALVLAAIITVFWMSCEGDDTSSTTATTLKPARTTKTATATTATTAATVETDTSTAAETATVETPAAPATPAPATTLEITQRQVSPSFVPPGSPVTFSAWVKGDAASVTMRVNERDSGNLALTVPLAFETHAGSGISKWSATVAAPMNKGVHRYFASAVSSDGVATEMPGVSGWTFCVGNVVQDCP